MTSFRAAALAHRSRSLVGGGRLLALSPGWVGWSYWLTVGLVAAGVLFAMLRVVPEYASGPAVIRVDGRRLITAQVAGTVTDVVAQPGQRTRPGDLLVRLQQASEAMELERVEQEIQMNLVRLLRDPGDAGARQVLTGLQAQRKLAQRRLDERAIRASAPGSIGDVRVRAGQFVQPGETLLSFVAEEGRATVVALLPGRHRPRLAPGHSLRMELDGFRYTYLETRITQVSDEIVGPAELQRYLGGETAGSVSIEGANFLVSAQLDGRLFTSEGAQFRYYDGMKGTAEVRVRRTSLLLAMFPALRTLFDR